MSAVVGQLGVGDPSSTRAVYAVVVALGLIGVLLVLLAIWLIRQTRPERELLAPLERMNDRSWRKQDPAKQRRTLDKLRPIGAHPLAPEPRAPDIDEEFEQPIPALASFEDLQADRAVDPITPPEPIVPSSHVADADDPDDADDDPIEDDE